MTGDYNYEHFRFRRYLEGTRSTRPAGEETPEATVRRRDGSRLHLSDLWRERPLVLEFGSFTCPVFVGKVDRMDRAAERFRGRAAFRVLYVREAHPGERRPAHESLADKCARARELVEEEGVRRPVLVDDLEGTVNRSWGATPNGVVIVGTDGLASYRADWCDPEEVEAELERLLEAGGEGAAVAPRDRRDNFDSATPGRMGTGLRVLGRAGSPAFRDLLSQLPRMIAHRLRPGPEPGVREGSRAAGG